MDNPFLQISYKMLSVARKIVEHLIKKYPERLFKTDNYGPRAQLASPLAFINKILLEHNPTPGLKTSNLV